MTLDQYKRHLIELLNHGLKKSFIDYFIKARYDVGTVRTWGDKKYKKISKNKWVRFYEGESRGKNQAVKNVIRKIQNAKNITELAEIIRANKNRFKDENGNIDSVVKQLLNEAKGKRPEKQKSEKNDSIIVKPITIGTPKQIEWATQIKKDKLKILQGTKEKLQKTNHPQKEFLLQLLNKRIKENAENVNAKPFIDFRQVVAGVMDDSRAERIIEFEYDNKTYGFAVTRDEYNEWRKKK